MAITKQTVKVYTRSQLETFGLAELKALSGNYSRLLEQDCTPSKYSNRKSAWMEAIEQAQTTWQQKQTPATDTLFDVSAYSQPHTHRGLSEHRIDTTGYDPSWDEIDEDLQDNEASPGLAATEDSALEPITVSGDGEKREQPQEICSSIENNPVPEVETQSDKTPTTPSLKVGDRVRIHNAHFGHNGQTAIILEDRGDGWFLTNLKPYHACSLEKEYAPDAPCISDDAPCISEFLVAEQPAPKVEIHSDREIFQQPTRPPLKLNPNRVPPYFGNRIHKVEESGQLSLLDLEEEEAPDPDDFPSVEAYESAWKEWSATHAEVPGFCSPDVESAIAVSETISEQPAPEKPGFCSPEIDSAIASNPQSPVPNPQSPITRAEAAAALGVAEDRILKDPTPTLNCVCVVYLDDQGKKRSQFVSYRRFEFWRESLKEAIDAASPETIQVVEERVLRELTHFQRHYPINFGMELRTALSHKKASLFFAKGASKKSSAKKAIAV